MTDDDAVTLLLLLRDYYEDYYEDGLDPPHETLVADLVQDLYDSTGSYLLRQHDLRVLGIESA